MTGYILRCTQSEVEGPSYPFRGARGATRWPMERGTRLGSAGCWNFVLRVGGRPREIGPEALPALAHDTPLFVALDGPPARDDDRTRLRDRIHGGGIVIASGEPSAWAIVLPELFGGRGWRGVDLRTAIGYRVAGRAELMAPPRWPVMTFDALPSEAHAVGEVVLVSGERQTPSRALLTTPPNAPAVVRWRNLVFLNAAPFHALQAWLQGWPI